MALSNINRLYSQLAQIHNEARKRLGRALTLTEKILIAHLDSSTPLTSTGFVRGKANVKFRPDRVAMQDATAQMAVLQFMSALRERVAVPTSIHCDHLIRAYTGANSDLKVALEENSEVYDFLASSASKYGIDFWKPGSGIIHQVVLENYAFPGGMMIGTDSHTPNGGGMGMIAIGVGGADAAEVIAGLPWAVTWPKLVGVKLTGALNGWSSAKDVILKLAGILTVKGGTGKIIEYWGPGLSSVSCTGRATIANMGAELGATTSLFPFDENTAEYLRATGRADLAELALQHRGALVQDPEVATNPEKYFDEQVEIDLSTLEPHVVGPHTPDLARPISKLAAEQKEKGYPDQIRFALIGSCTNSSYEDIGRAAHIAKQAAEQGLKAVIPFMITPGSEAVYETIKRDGFLQQLESIGGTVLANACGPCIGQWKRTDIKPGELNTIVTSFNRNFPRRNDGNAETMAFIASPEIVTAYALSGSLSFNPLANSLNSSDGSKFKLSPPKAEQLPSNGFTMARDGLLPPAPEGKGPAVSVSPNSDRLALLEPFAPWSGTDFIDLAVLLKAVGKCTTDHISPAGPWLKYRGHLDRISDNMFLGAKNAFATEPGTGVNILTGATENLSKIARHYKQTGLGWVSVGDENYGEGSSREHAAMSPRFLGAKAVIVRSFARIHETNLKKQGILALTFTNPADYDRIQVGDRLSITGIAGIAPGKPLTLIVKHADGSSFTTSLSHSFDQEQIDWFKKGSALNSIR